MVNRRLKYEYRSSIGVLKDSNLKLRELHVSLSQTNHQHVLCSQERSIVEDMDVFQDDGHEERFENTRSTIEGDICLRIVVQNRTMDETQDDPGEDVEGETDVEEGKRNLMRISPSIRE